MKMPSWSLVLMIALLVTFWFGLGFVSVNNILGLPRDMLTILYLLWIMQGFATGAAIACLIAKMLNRSSKIKQ